MTTHHLPRPATSFVGRAEEIADIGALLADPSCRLLTLVGPGGSGKTRLAIQVAEERAGEFPDGAHFVSLGSVGGSESIIPAVAGVFGLYLEASAPPKQRLFDFLRAKRLLLVLDNFEHLLDGGDLISDVLEAAPDLKILVTSREALNLEEEWIRRVDGLSFPSGVKLAAFEDFSAIRLFVERARRVRSDFSLAAERDGVVQICQQVQGMPLGVELAAAWLRTMSCAQIAAEIQQNLDFLASPLRNVTERHQSMRAVFDHSWRLLTPDERRVFRSLAVFRGGFTRAAADRVAGASFAALTVLLDKSLLQWTPPVRYDVHELLRQYAEQQLEAAGDGAAARSAHSDYYLDLLARRDADIKGLRQRQALNELRAEFENIRAAWRWAVEHHQFAAISLTINCLVNFAEMNNRLGDVFRLVETTATAVAPNASDAALPVWDKLVVRREWLKHRLLIDVDSTLVENILERARERGDREETAWCLWVLADLASIVDGRAGRVTMAEESLALRRALGDEFYIAHALLGLHAAYFQAHQSERSTECVRESADIRRKVGDNQGLSLSLSWLGAKSLYEGRLAEAERDFDEAIELQEDLGRVFGYVALKALKAALTFWRGDIQESVRLIQTALEFAQGQNPFGSRNLCLAIQSFGVSLAGDYQNGRALSEQAGLSHHGDNALWIDWGLALAACASGDDRAGGDTLRIILREATDDFTSVTFRWLCLPLGAIWSARAGQPERAAELLGLTRAGPTGLTGWLDHWSLFADMRRQLEFQLGAAAFTAAGKRGQELSLDATVRTLRDPLPSAASAPQLASAPTANRSLPEPLSARELEVLGLLVVGLSNAEIAARLVIAVSTVKVHARAIYGKLGVTSRTQAIAQAHQLRLLPSR